MLPLATICFAFVPSAIRSPKLNIVPSAIRSPQLNRARPAVMESEEVLQELREQNAKLQIGFAKDLDSLQSLASAGAAADLSKPVNPLAAFFAAGGALGIGFAAYCTSMGSPPDGLAVGIASVLFMSAGAALIESE